MLSRQAVYPLNQSPFFRLKSRKKLAEVLQISPAKLKDLSLRPEDFYFEREIFDAAKGKSRRLESPTYLLKTVHQRIRELLSKIAIPEYILSPRQGCSTVDNALLHKGSACLYQVDIKSYFPSTPQRHVYHFFNKRMECSEDVAGIIAKISMLNGHLPTGSSLSPVMSYYANMGMWEEINSLALDANCQLSVWVDDICISGDKISGELIWKVKKTIFRSGFNYHKEKFHTSSEPRRITGIIVSRSRLMAPKGKHKKLYDLRRELSSATNPFDRLLKEARIEGLRNYIS